MTEPTKDQKIWQVVAAIPPGCVASYGQIAFPIGSEAFETQAQSLREEGVVVVDGRISMKQFGWRP